MDGKGAGMGGSITFPWLNAECPQYVLSWSPQLHNAYAHSLTQIGKANPCGASTV